jgi:multidrug efflux pump subunit AcrA (membrane-fusion protein)
MKKILFPIAMLTILAACSSNKAADKKSELEKLKKQQTALTAQIAKLEKEMGVMSPEDAARNTKNVAVIAVQGTEFKHYIDVQGKVDGDESVTLSPQMPGMVAKINVVRGQQVRKGQVLAELDNRVMRQGIQELKTQLAFVTIVWIDSLGSVSVHC